MKKSKLGLLLFLALFSCKAQQDIPVSNNAIAPTVTVSEERKEQTEPPTLIIGITIDQMRIDYLTRFADDYSENGFKRLLRDGVLLNNTHYDYMPTFTGPGHACIYTGTGPSLNGIIANDWFDREKGRLVYCAQDSSVIGVGTSSEEGMRSPSRLLTTTLCDQIKINSNFRSKTIGIAMKDRGGILPAGRSADAAYWYIGANEGNWISSTWYMNSLPPWVQNFNQRNLSESYIQEGWTLLKDPSVYDESLPDNNAYELPFSGMIRPVFPYVFKDDSIRIKNRNYDLVKGTPLGMKMTTEFALAAIQGEGLGKDEFPDVLCLSYSGTDYVGHRFGIQSKETQDCYLRLDMEIEKLLNWLDANLPGQYLIFLCSDHGGADVPSHMQSVQIAADYWNPGNMVDDVKTMLNQKFGVGNYVLNYSNDQFFLDRKLISERKINMESMQDVIVQKVLEFDGVYTAIAAHDLMSKEYSDGIRHLISNGFHPKRSGDVMVVTMPGWIEYGRSGTTHGSPFPYDTHVPLIFFGNGIQSGIYNTEAHVSDITPTLCSFLGIMEPNGSTGAVLDVLKK